MANKSNIQPLGDRVLVKAIEEAEQVKGGIIIPDSAKEKPQEAKVVALGTGRRDDSGKLIDFSVKVGDLVLTSKYGGTEINYNDEKYTIIREEDILAVVGK
ncbi:MAG: co-chaperone GroES [Verrucomicrobia bacterium]|nr:MAG: co-chaperone GroES [Verrucomicrobiota bacterium]